MLGAHWRCWEVLRCQLIYIYPIYLISNLTKLDKWCLELTGGVERCWDVSWYIFIREAQFATDIHQNSCGEFGNANVMWVRCEMACDRANLWYGDVSSWPIWCIHIQCDSIKAVWWNHMDMRWFFSPDCIRSHQMNNNDGAC